MQAIPLKPEISVVIPVYRVEPFLRECVESVLAQTFRQFEIVLVDDGSPDACPQICDDYAASYPPSAGLPYIKVVHKANAGLGMARNSGMDAATGKYVFFLDSDDTLRPDTLARLLSVMAAHPGVQAVHGCLCRFIKPGRYSADVSGGPARVIDSPQSLRTAALCNFASFPGDEPYTLESSACGTLYDLDFLRRYAIKFLSERLYISEDYIFNFEVALHAKGIAQVPDTLYRYRVNPASLTQQQKTDVMQRTTDYCEQIEKMMRRAGFDEEAAKYAFGYAASRIRFRYKRLFLTPGRLADKLHRAREWRALPYFERMAREFNPSAMSCRHRLNYALFKAARFRTLYALIRVQGAVRRLRGHIGD